eukprot:2660275-Rhodomonas_salina.1
MSGTDSSHRTTTLHCKINQSSKKQNLELSGAEVVGKKSALKKKTARFVCLISGCTRAGPEVVGADVEEG